MSMSVSVCASRMKRINTDFCVLIFQYFLREGIKTRQALKRCRANKFSEIQHVTYDSTIINNNQKKESARQKQKTNRNLELQAPEKFLQHHEKLFSFEFLITPKEFHKCRMRNVTYGRKHF